MLYMTLIVLTVEKRIGGYMGGSKNRFNCSSSIIQFKKIVNL